MGGNSKIKLKKYLVVMPTGFNSAFMKTVMNLLDSIKAANLLAIFVTISCSQSFCSMRLII